MPADSRLDRVYAQLMSDHPYGWALYKKVTRRDIFPGSYGYFDADGDWRTLLDLNQHDPDMVRQGWTEPSQALTGPRPTESITWGPKTAGFTKTISTGGTAGSAIAGSPVKASASLSFESEGKHGAVLVTESPVLRYSIGDEQEAYRWMMENKHKMMSAHEDILKKHGIWVVTKTYCTRRCAIAMMSERNSSVAIGLDADVDGLFTLTPKSSWKSTTGVAATELHEDENHGVVVFVSGIYVSRRFWGSSWALDQAAQKDKILRGDEAADDDDENAPQLDVRYYPSLDAGLEDLGDDGCDSDDE